MQKNSNDLLLKNQCKRSQLDLNQLPCILKLYLNHTKMVVIYTKGYCPYCTHAKNLLNELNIKFEEHDIGNNQEAMQKLVEKSGMMTVPQVFLNDKLLGGYDDIAKLHSEGKLEDLCK